MLIALLLFVPVTAVMLMAESRLLDMSEGSPSQTWLSVHLYLPLMRAFALLIFLLAAYPDLYGLDAAPSVHALLASGRYRADQLVNVMLVLSLLLPLLPLVHRIAGLTLAFQGICATALVGSWLAPEFGVSLSLVPDVWLALRIAAVLAAARLLAELLASEFFSGRARQEMVVEIARMAAQLPAVVIYAHHLGSQLGG